MARVGGVGGLFNTSEPGLRLTLWVATVWSLGAKVVSIKIGGLSTAFLLTHEMVSELKFEQGENVPGISVEFSATDDASSP